MEDLIRTVPGQTQDGRPFDSYEREQVKKGNWRLERISKDILGTPRDLKHTVLSVRPISSLTGSTMPRTSSTVMNIGLI